LLAYANSPVLNWGGVFMNASRKALRMRRNKKAQRLVLGLEVFWSG
jgi:hypothetical protein